MLPSLPTDAPYEVCTPIIDAAKCDPYIWIKSHKNLDIDDTKCTQSKHEWLLEPSIVFWYTYRQYFENSQFT